MVEENTAPETQVEDAPEPPAAVSYESIRDGAGDIAASWRIADREVSALREKYKKIEEDARYSDEHKASEAWRAFENSREKIVAARQEAREKIRAEARVAEHRPLPRPTNQSLIMTTDANLLTAQMEGQRLDRRVERMTSSGGPFKGNVSEILRSEYQKGLERGGPEGRALCKGVLFVAEDRGISHEDLLNELRSEEHLEALDQARRYYELAALIGNDIPAPPVPKPGSNPRGSEEPRSGPRAFVPRQPTVRETTSKGKSRRPPWS